jgi:hypothetical protein
MADRPLDQTLVIARIGRTELGPAAVSFDEDALSIVLRGAPADRTMRVELSAIEGVYDDGHEVTIPLRNGTRLVLEVESSGDLRDAILVLCMALPELTRALRALGSRRGARSSRATAGDEQRRFFAPLLDARRRATGAAGLADTIGAFDADVLAASIHRVVQAFASQRVSELGPERRALEAELFDAVEPLQASLQRVRDAAPGAKATAGELRPWRAWAAELQAAFEAADRVWLALDAVLEGRPLPAKERSQR